MFDEPVEQVTVKVPDTVLQGISIQKYQRTHYYHTRLLTVGTPTLLLSDTQLTPPASQCPKKCQPPHWYFTHPMLETAHLIQLGCAQHRLRKIVLFPSSFGILFFVDKVALYAPDEEQRGL